MRIFRFIPAAVGAIALAACGSSMTSGTVIAKKDIPAHSWIFEDPIPHTTCIPVGKIEDCSTFYTYIPITEHADEEWTITFQQCKKQKCDKRTVDVSQTQYGHIAIGSFYKIPGTKKPGRGIDQGQK